MPLNAAQRARVLGAVLLAVVEETHFLGPAPLAVIEYLKDPSPNNPFFQTVGGLRLQLFYVAPGRPTDAEKQSLWMEIRSNIAELDPPLDPAQDLALGDDPGGWDSGTKLRILSAIVAGALA